MRNVLSEGLYPLKVSMSKEQKGCEKVSRLKEAKETRQLNAVFDLTLDPVLKEKSCRERYCISWQIGIGMVLLIKYCYASIKLTSFFLQLSSTV